MLENGDSRGLPSQPAPLIGRGEELKRLRDQLLGPGPRLITLTGPPGTGKTRLALAAATELAPRFKDGARFVDLSPVDDAALVPQAIAESLGVHERAGQPLLNALSDYLRGVEQLLLLDNFEQVLEAAPLVARLLASCPRIRVLATSRAPLRLRWEQEFPVAPLRLPDPEKTDDLEGLLKVPAVALFVERARA